MPLQIVRNDIVNMDVDAIVNSANPKPVIGAGVDTSIHIAAGPSLLAERKQIGDISVGDVVCTKGYNLRAKYVFHASAPIWADGKHDEIILLNSCYEKALAMASDMGLNSIAFPLLSAGNYGFPKAVVLQTAMNAISHFLDANSMDVYLVVFSKDSFVLSERLVDQVASFIDEHYVEQVIHEQYSQPNLSYHEKRRSWISRKKADILQKNSSESITSVGAPAPAMASFFEDSDKPSIEEALSLLDAGFSETMITLIDSKGMTDPEVYKRANMSRQTFNKIKNNPGYKPSKATAFALSIAMRLTIEEAKDFISRAGFTFSHSSKFDLIVEWSIRNGKYDINELNSILFDFDQPLLGA